MKVLTVAVPAYNSESCIQKCLDSLVESEVLPELEVIIINDGSKDGTLDIAHDYERRFPESVHVIDKENGGHGSGINTASAAAVGKFFQVVDSDDWVITENLPKLLAVLRETEADIVLANYHMVNIVSGRRQPFSTEGIEPNREYDIEEFLSYPAKTKSCCYFHGVIYRTEFYRGTGIRLSEKIFYEDQEYATLPFYYAHSILPTDVFIYQYQIGNNAQSISSVNQAKNMWQIEKVLCVLISFYNTHRNMSAGKKAYFLFKLSGFLTSYYVAGLLKCADRKKGREDARKMCSEVRSVCPELYRASEKNYRVAMALHRLHISSAMLEKAKDTGLYYLIRKKL
jgi:glycosyltransferase involved in cell wall biosynthesis